MFSHLLIVSHRRRMGVKIGGNVERRNGKQMKYTEFVEFFLAKSKPVVLIGLMDDWEACKEWVSADGNPNLRFLSSNFGDSKVQVADCGAKEFTDQKRIEMSFSEFISGWLKISDSGNDGADGYPLLYLKDWHFVKEYPEYNAYSTPVFFRDDWRNLYLDKYPMQNNPDTCQERDEICCSDYRFVYMGAKGTWTPLHADVFKSYSWSANVCGRKKWYFLSPSQCHLVFDRNMKSSIYNIFEDVCELKFLGIEKAIWMECTQEKDEIIFVPSGWYRQVHNLEDTISINHNWFNAYNISWVWNLLLREYHVARFYIEDIKDICDDFEGLCQKNLAASAGMNFCDLFGFMIRFAFANLIILHQLTSVKRNISCSSSQMAQLILFNLQSIQQISLKMKSVDIWQNHGLTIDLKEVIQDKKFLDFCNSLGRTYSIMYANSNTGFNLDRTLLEPDIFDISNENICSPKELATFVDYAHNLCMKFLADFIH